jgi:hypothetical protein
MAESIVGTLSMSRTGPKAKEEEEEEEELRPENYS